MKPTASEPELVEPATEQFAFAVECARPALKRMGRRGAGALFGRKTESAVSVMASRPFPFPYPATESYALAEPEEAKLEELLRSCEWDARLRGMIPVGWYVSRRAGRLGAADEVLFDRFFPEPWQIAVVNTHGEAECCFRGLDGALHTAPLPPAPRGKAVWAGMAAIVAAALLLAALLLLSRPAAKPRAVGGIGLGLSENAGQLRISWEQSSPEVAAAKGAHMEIDDGGSLVRIGLDRTELRTGSVFYSRWSEYAVVRMVLERPGLPPLEEFARFSGPPVAPVAAAVAPPAPEVEAAPAVPPAPARVEVRAWEADRAEVAPEVPPREFRPPRVRLAAPVQPVIDAPALAVAPRTATALPLDQRPRALPARARQAEAPPRGQIIWTGRLERRGVLQIEGRQATTGYVSGALPGAPAQIVVLPGELTDTGLRLYTANPALANYVERAGPQNGWNPTEYVWDPLRAKEISVLEAPGKYNGWKHLVLRAENRGYSVLVLKWEGRP